MEFHRQAAQQQHTFYGHNPVGMSLTMKFSIALCLFVYRDATPDLDEEL